MRGNLAVWSTAILSATVGVLMVLGATQGSGFAVALASPASGAAAASGASSTTVSIEQTPGSGATNFAKATPAATGPHPGTLAVYEPVPGGATTEDPAVAYDTTSYEPILNVYETLVSYNGSSTASFVPTLATCVPLQGPQCADDYGAGFTGVFNATGGNFTGSNGEPVYWTFVLDPAAHFYDPATKASWKVYPTDVMFSISRTLAWSTYPEATKTAGWIIAQALLPPGNATWDKGIHDPYNNTPAHVLGSMLINDSSFCPTSAMNGLKGDGCITFVANGSGQVWPEFLDFVEDNLGSSVVPCGWFTYKDSGVTGWAGTKAADGDGSCTLPNGATSTSGGNWTTYLAGLTPTGWDTFIKLDAAYPSPQPNIQWSMVGSGPYYASVTAGLSYALAANPAYLQPSGCSGSGGLTVYTGYCDPAPGGYIPNVDVTWETEAEGDTLGTDAIVAGTADFAGIYTTETTTLLGYVHSGLWQYLNFPTLSTAFTTMNFGVSYSAYNTTFAGTPLEANPIPPNLFTTIGLRNFYIAAYPYTTIQDTINTVDGIEFSFNAGGPIPVNMGNYYPSNVSWPYLLGNPTQPATTVNSSAWWWAQLTTPSSPYYNATVATKCTSSSPCTFPIGYFDGAPADLTLIDDWAGELSKISGGAIAAWPLALTFTQFLTDTLIGAYESPLVSVVGFGWAPDYPDPTDYVAPIIQPNGDYTGPDTVSQQLTLAAHTDNASCGHYGLSTVAGAYANLTYWATQARNPANGKLNDACEGVAYNVASYWMAAAGALPAGPQRVLDYNQIEQITNALGLYVWNGQANELIGFAPWINPASVNTNPVIGGGGDLVYFHLQYRNLYTTTVSESGLPSGTKWTASLGNSTASSTSGSISFASQPNGTYSFAVSSVPGYSVSPSNGTLTVSGSTTKSVTYTPIPSGTKTTNVYFNETGLVTGIAWTVVVPGYGAQTSTSSSLTFVLPQSKSYAYAPQVVLGYNPVAAGTVTVGTSPVSTALVFHGFFGPVYTIYFNETGLGAGVTWATTVNTTYAGVPTIPTTVSGKTSSILVYEQNGTTNWTITVPSGYALAPTIGSVVLNGSNRSVGIYFIKLPSTSIAWSYLSTLAYALIGFFAVLMLIGFALAAHYRRRGRPAKAPETWTGEQQPPSSPGGGESPPPAGQGGPPTK